MSSFSATVRIAAAAAFLVAGTLGADARAGGGSSFGSRGARTYSAPPSTATAPSYAAPIERSVAPRPGFGQSAAPAFQQRPGFFSGGFGRGLLGGLVGAGLFGMLMGHGFFGGLGGLMSLFGLLIQVGLVVLLVRFVIGMMRRRSPLPAGAAPASYFSGGAPAAGAGPTTSGAQTRPISLQPKDFDAFERLLGAVQDAYGREDGGALSRLATAEMAGNFARELAANQSQGVVNRTSGAKLLQGDLSEAWAEPGSDYATVAMRYAVLDVTVERASGRVVAGNPNVPEEVKELWTFRRSPDASDWVLSAIQQAR